MLHQRVSALDLSCEGLSVSVSPGGSRFGALSSYGPITAAVGSYRFTALPPLRYRTTRLPVLSLPTKQGQLTSKHGEAPQRWGQIAPSRPLRQGPGYRPGGQALPP